MPGGEAGRYGGPLGEESTGGNERFGSFAGSFGREHDICSLGTRTRNRQRPDFSRSVPKNQGPRSFPGKGNLKGGQSSLFTLLREQQQRIRKSQTPYRSTFHNEVLKTPFESTPPATINPPPSGFGSGTRNSIRFVPPYLGFGIKPPFWVSSKSLVARFPGRLIGVGSTWLQSVGYCPL